ncbi:MAG: patatin-like phospholipase family protein [Campylobacterota bacterium]|nr:patatin-like phospholipase family protein [Campylobacterota bacterium]
MIKKLQSKPFSLVLSGGGALGIAELGVISDLEKESLVPREIIGTSMGSIIGACVAIGMREKEIYTLFVEFSNIFNWVKFSFTGNAIIKHEKIEKILDDIFHDIQIRESKIPLKIIATNILSGEIKVFDSNDNVTIKDAILASMAIPGVFEEKTIQDVIYSDGFLCENLGVNQATSSQVLAVDVLGKNSFETQMPNNFFKTSNVLEMFEKSMRILIYNQTKAILKSSSKNIYLLEPDTKKFKTFHFHRYDELKKLGLGLLS